MTLTTTSPDVSATTTHTTQPRAAGRTCTLACAGPAIFVVALVVMHFAQPDMIHTSTISKYALGPAGWLLPVAFIAVGAGYAALAWHLRGRRGARLLTATAVAFGLMGSFPIDAVGPERIVSVPGALHTAGFVAAVVLVHPAMLRITRHLNGPGRPSRLAAAILAPPLLIAAFLLPALAGALTFRLWTVTLLVWSVLTAITTSSPPASARP
jgi:hypothetical protein